jgi:hypothetical protein
MRVPQELGLPVYNDFVSVYTPVAKESEAGFDITVPEVAAELSQWSADGQSEMTAKYPYACIHCTVRYCFVTDIRRGKLHLLPIRSHHIFLVDVLSNNWPIFILHLTWINVKRTFNFKPCATDDK